ncbi:hypothetical protein [Rhizobium phage RHph_X2_24]|nr:hypothetical protein [Rhizobium phage RHph_X2_24]
MPLIPCNVHVIAPLKQIRSFYAVYMHEDAIENRVLYIGVTRLDELFTFNDALCNSMWSDTVDRPEIVNLSVRVVALTEDEREAIMEQRRLIAEHRPFCNVKGYWVAPSRQKILCIETGEIFNSISDVEKAHGISRSAMSNHLNGKTGFKSVRGRTYKRTVK